MTASEKTQHVLSKVFRYEREERNDEIPPITNADPFLEPEPTIGEFIEEITPSLRDIGLYFYNLFPFLSWILKYNLTWALGDLIAGKLAPVLPACPLVLIRTRRDRRRCRRAPEHGVRPIGKPRC